MDLTHRVTLAQVSGGEPEAPTEEERAALADFAALLGAAELHRLWQLLLKGHDEVRTAPDPLVSLQMALLRILHAGQMPDPGKLAKRIEELAVSGVAASAVPAAQDATPSAPLATAPALDWAALVGEVDRAGMLHVAEVMRSRVRVIELASERVMFEQADNFPDDPAPEIRDALFKVTGKRWLVERGSGTAQPSLRETIEADARAAQERVLSDPLVNAAFEAFPEAELLGVEGHLAAASASPPWN